MSEESGSHSGVDTTTGERVIVVHTPSNPAVPTVAPPASKWDIIKSTATMVTAVAGACVVLYGAGDALFTRYAAAAEMKAEDAGRKAEEALTEVAAHKKEVGQRLDRLEQKMDEAARKADEQNRELYRAIMYSQRSPTLEMPARKDGGK